MDTRQGLKEKDIKHKFIHEWGDNLKQLFKSENLRLYSIEFPVRTNDGTKYADLVYEIDENDIPMKNKMMILELKKDKIDTGAVEQVLRYSHFTKLQLYRKQKITSFIAGPEFSDWEVKMCRDNNVFPIQFDLSGNMRIL